MSTWIIIPVYSLQKRGSRLKGVLSVEERTELVLSMLRNMLLQLAQLAEVDQVMVVSRDEEVVALAEAHAAIVQRGNTAKLNDTLTSAAKRAWRDGAETIAILPSNLARLNSADVRNLLAMETQVAICPDNRFDDTNIILLRRLPTFKFQFGEESFSKHLAEASKHSAVAQMAFAPSFEFALKTPADWREYKQTATVLA